jgi:O-antigen/teichoic acid export membrane protein
MVSTSGSLLSAIGRTYMLRNLGFLSLLFLVGPLLAGLPWGIYGVAAGYCIGNIAWSYPVLQTVLKQLDRNYFDFVRIIYIPLVIALLSGIATHVVTLAWEQVVMPSLALTVVDSCVYLTLYMLAILVFYPNMWHQFKRDVTGKPMPVHMPPA